MLPLIRWQIKQDGQFFNLTICSSGINKHTELLLKVWKVVVGLALWLEALRKPFLRIDELQQFLLDDSIGSDIFHKVNSYRLSRLSFFSWFIFIGAKSTCTSLFSLLLIWHYRHSGLKDDQVVWYRTLFIAPSSLITRLPRVFLINISCRDCGSGEDGVPFDH